MLTLHLPGNRSNASALWGEGGIGVRGWHTLRTVQQLLVEIGIGPPPPSQLDLVSTRWFDTKLDTTEGEDGCRQPLTVPELVLPTGSPAPTPGTGYGTQPRFITDLLGAPVGLPAAPGHYIEADPDELVRIGGDRDFVPRGSY